MGPINRIIMGETMVTQRDVAEKAGVSFITVSRVINNNGYVKEETRKKVLTAIQELDYYTNNIGRALNTQNINTIGIITPAPAHIAVHATEYYNLLMAGIEKSTLSHDFDLLLSTYRNEDPKADYLRLYFQRKVDGLILITPELSDSQIMSITRKNIPCVIIGDRPAGNIINYVDSDNFGGMCRITEYLIGKGHRQIAFLKGIGSGRNACDRLEGFLATMRKNVITIHDDWVFEGDYTPISGQNALKKIVSFGKRPSALICANDLMALGALAETKKFKIKVPEELALIGFDGIGITAFTDPPLTTATQPLFDMGLTAAELLYQKIKDPERPPEFKIFPVKFVERKSVSDLKK